MKSPRDFMKITSVRYLETYEKTAQPNNLHT